MPRQTSRPGSVIVRIIYSITASHPLDHQTDIAVDDLPSSLYAVDETTPVNRLIADIGFEHGRL